MISKGSSLLSNQNLSAIQYKTQDFNNIQLPSQMVLQYLKSMQRQKAQQMKKLSSN